MIGVASILPFVTVLTNPSVIETNIVLIIFISSCFFGIENHQQFVFYFCFTNPFLHSRLLQIMRKYVS